MNSLVNSYNLFELFQTFFLDEQIQILVDNTNKNMKNTYHIQNAHAEGTDRKEREIRRWIDTNIKELNAFFGVDFY